MKYSNKEHLDSLIKNDYCKKKNHKQKADVKGLKE